MSPLCRVGEDHWLVWVLRLEGTFSGVPGQSVLWCAKNGLNSAPSHPHPSDAMVHAGPRPCDGWVPWHAYLGEAECLRWPFDGQQEQEAGGA